MLVCPSCNSTEIEDSRCQKCGAWVTEGEAWGSVAIETVSPENSQETRAKPVAEIRAPSVVRGKAILTPVDNVPADDHDHPEEVTDVGEVFPRLSTDAIISERHGQASGDEILDLMEPMVATQAPQVNPALNLTKCTHCGALMNLEKSRFCEVCGVRAPKRQNTSKRVAARPRTTSKIVLRCKLCGYNVPSGSPSCRNCGTPVV